MTRRPGARGCAIAGALLIASGAVDAGEASGTASYHAKSGALVVAIKHAYLVTGPDFVSGKTIRRVVLSGADVGDKLAACETMACSDGGIEEGLTIDFDAGPRINYWLVANHQLAQYSATAEPSSLKLTVNTPTRLAGKWDLDASASGGPRIQIEFDAPLVKEIKKL